MYLINTSSDLVCGLVLVVCFLLKIYVSIHYSRMFLKTKLTLQQGENILQICYIRVCQVILIIICIIIVFFFLFYSNILLIQSQLTNFEKKPPNYREGILKLSNIPVFWCCLWITFPIFTVYLTSLLTWLTQAQTWSFVFLSAMESSWFICFLVMSLNL